MTKRILILAACMMHLAAWLQAADEVPLLINYQGKLQDGSGNAVTNGNYQIAFRIWSDANGGVLIWGRTYPVSISGGLFNVILGDGGVPIPGAQTNDLRASFQDSTRYLGLTVTQDATGATIPSPQEIVPRQQFLSAPYALKAAMAGDAGKLGGTVPGGYLLKAGDTVNGNLTVNGALGVNGASSLSGPTTVGGNLAVSGSFTIMSGSSTVFQVTSSGVQAGGLVPVGGIIMWGGSTVPAGWALCDGNNGTPNLRDRFILGSGTYSSGNWGGAATVTLTIDQIPPHSHYYGDNYFLPESADWRGGGGSSWGDQTGDNRWQGEWTGSTGGGQAVSIMPPFYVLAFIQRKQ